MQIVASVKGKSGLCPDESQTGEAQDSFKKNSLNTTAYRIFKLLQWLIEAPLSVEALNQRFLQEPLIQKTLSTDSIWLYINTLKMLGCKIRRPTSRNNFCYELTYHPFGLLVTEEDIELLVQAKAFAQTHFNHQEMLILDNFLKKVLTRNAHSDSINTIDQIFEKSRSLDYATYSHQIELLEQWIAEKKLLQLTYLSPLHGEKSMVFLPCELQYERGVVYVKGDQPDKLNLTLLRIERIQQAKPLENEILRQTLLGRQAQLETVTLRIFVNSPVEFEPLNLDEDVTFVDKEHWPYMQLTLYTRDFFLLKQKLLEQGRPFHILGPERFYEEMMTTLESMKAMYGEEPHGNS